MAPYVKMNHSVQTGLSEGDFHRLSVLHNGDMTNIISLIGSLGGSGAVQSATTPLSISGGVLTIDLAAYITSSAVNAALSDYRLESQLFDNVTAGAGLVLVKSGATMSIGLTGAESRTQLYLQDSGGTVRNLAASLTGAIVWNGSQLANINDLAGKLDTLTVSAPLAISGTGTSRALSTLWKPSTVTVGTGLFALASDANGTLSLSLTGTESRTTMRLADSNAVVRDLTSTTGGALTWAGAALPTAADLALKADDSQVTLAVNSLLVSLAAKAETTALTAQATPEVK